MSRTTDFLVHLIALFAFFWIFVFALSFPVEVLFFVLGDITLALLVWETIARRRELEIVKELKGGLK